MNYFLIGFITTLVISIGVLLFIISQKENKLLQCSAEKMSYMQANMELIVKIQQQNEAIAKSKAETVLLQSKLSTLRTTTNKLYEEVEKLQGEDALGASFKTFKQQLDTLP